MAFRRARSSRRRASPYDMQSVKICRNAVEILGATTCTDPLTVSFLLIHPTTTVIPANVVTQIGASKGLVFGGLSAQVRWSCNPLNAAGVENTIDFIQFWEAIHVHPLDHFGNPPGLPVLSRGNVGADQDVDLVWKRLTQIPFWGEEAAPGIQLASTNQNTNDEFRVKAKRRLTERQCLMYSCSFTHGMTGEISIPVSISAWFRIAVKWLR